MIHMLEYYGINPQDVALFPTPKVINDQVRAKMDVIDTAESMKRVLDTLASKFRQAPIENDEKHAEIMMKVYHELKSVQTSLDEVLKGVYA